MKSSLDTPCWFVHVVCVTIVFQIQMVFATPSMELVEPEITDEDRSHWAYQPVFDYSPPEVENAELVRNSIDRFILARLEKTGLSLMPSADKYALVRRLSFDLRGLPPSIEEVDAFLADSSPTAYEDLVDRFLASPAFGERWAQHWLDVARFAETDGFEHDAVRPDAWRYRDWVIQAFNADMPYDEFIRQQLAGDELYPKNEDVAFATGFLVAGPDMPDINLMEERRHTVLNEMTSTTGLSFMGLTMGCAQCHDHKSDPISQADFYRLRALFADMTIPKKFKQLSPRFVPLSEEVPTSHLMLRGDFRFKGPEVGAAFIRVVNPEDARPHSSSNTASGLGRRTALADWLTDPAHPLTRRVLVNRLWQHIYGRPIVGTPNDFGILGDRPTHPELLDWLAVELVRQGWSVKSMLRLMVSSTAYRQVSKPANNNWSRALAVDPDNELLSRMNRKRLEGEAVRDAMLAVTGKLNRKMGGSGIHAPLPTEVAITLLQKQWEVDEDVSEHYRRSIYLFVRRNLRYPMFDVFDRPDTNASCGRRNISTTAPQSLTLLNSEFSMESARRLAGALLDEGETTPSAWVKSCYNRVLSRQPSVEELERSTRFIEEQASFLLNENRGTWELAAPTTSIAHDPYVGAALTDFCLAVFNTNEMIYLD